MYINFINNGYPGRKLATFKATEALPNLPAVKIWTKYTTSSKKLLKIEKSQIGMIDDGMLQMLSELQGYRL